MTFALNNLRRDVCRCTTHCIRFLSITFKFLGKPKVYKLYMPIENHGDHNIFWLKVSVYYILRVQILKSLKCFFSIELHIHCYLRVHYSQLTLQGTSFYILHFEVKTWWALKRILNLDNRLWTVMLRLQHFHDAKFLNNMINLFHLLDVFLGDNFKSWVLLRLGVPCQHNFTKVADSYRLL